MSTGYFTYYTHGREPFRYGLSQFAPPANEPITLADAKNHCRIDVSTDDAAVTSMIVAAREMVENDTGRRIVTQTWDMYLDRFPIGFRDMRCPWGPWQSISSIKYIDLSGTQQTWGSTHYGLDSTSFEPRIYLQWADIYPVPRPIQNAIVIRHVSGYTSPPESLKHAIRVLVAHWYDQARSMSSGLEIKSVPKAYESLIAPYRQSIV